MNQSSADKLRCWQEAEAVEGPHSRTRFIALGAAAAIPYGNSAETIAARDARVERTAEACVTKLGYTFNR